MKITLVVGAASGIGKGIADVRDDTGLMVIRADIAFSKTEQNVVYKHIDATDETSVTNLMQYLYQKYDW